MRLFIAIELSDGLRNGLTQIQASLKRRGVRGNFTPMENLHLTLAFFGYPGPEVKDRGERKGVVEYK